jgi:structural maintenance of chromosome 4
MKLPKPRVTSAGWPHTNPRYDHNYLGPEVAKSKAEKQKTKHQKSYEDSEKEIAAAAEELETLASEAATQTSDITASKHKSEEAQDALSSKQD